MLISNGQRLTCNPMRYMGSAGTTVGTGVVSVDSGAWMMKGARNNFYAGEATVDAGASIANRNGFPVGALHPISWVLPIKAGGLSARGLALYGEGDMSGAVAGGKNAEAAIAGVGDLTAIGQLIVSLAATIAGSGTISGADLKAFLNAVAALSGSGGVTAQLDALADLASAIAGTGTVAGTTVITALGTLAAQINVTGDVLTSANVANSIWNAVAASYNNSGTMGEKLNSASSAGDPWGTALPGAYAAGTAGDILGNLMDGTDGVETGLTVRHALRLIAAAVAGKLSGAATTTITIRNAVVDDKNRIIATVDSDGNRSAITYDLTD